MPDAVITDSPLPVKRIIGRMTIAILFLLAVARITRLLNRDTITQPLRDAIYVVSPPPHDVPGSADKTWVHVSALTWGDRVRVIWAAWRGKWEVVGRYVAPDGSEPGWLGKMWSCSDCLGVWVAAALAVLTWQYTDTMYWVLLGASGAFAASVAQRLIYRD